MASQTAGMELTNAIEISRLSKRLGGRLILDQLDLQVPAKSVFAFLGNNGAGKSTTIRILTGLLEADAGQVRVLGQNLGQGRGAGNAGRDAILRQLGCLVDAPSLYPNLTAQEFLKIACLLKQVAKPAHEIARVLELVQLQAGAKTRIAHYSLGMKQRLALAHALIGAPALLILDEPANGLDPQGIRDMRQLLSDLAHNGDCTIFVSSHQLDEVEKFATHLALLHGGKLVAQSAIGDWVQAQCGALTLEIGDAAQAMQVLQHYPYPLSHSHGKHGATTISLQQVPFHATADLHHDLIAAGVRLFQSVYQRPSLEEWFLQVTTGKGGMEEGV